MRLFDEAFEQRRRVQEGIHVGKCGLHMVGVPPKGHGNQPMRGRAGAARAEAPHTERSCRGEKKSGEET